MCISVSVAFMHTSSLSANCLISHKMQLFTGPGRGITERMARMEAQLQEAERSAELVCLCLCRHVCALCVKSFILVHYAEHTNPHTLSHTFTHTIMHRLRKRSG